MDKIEYKEKLEEISFLAEEGKFPEAADLVDTIDWRHVKSVRTLYMVGEIYEANKRYEDALRVLKYAYKRSSTSKTVVYRLAELSLRVGNVSAAKGYANELSALAPHDSSKYILDYKVKRAEGRSLDEQIKVLEKLKDREYTERWSYELARLYLKAGQEEKCVETCDDIILWFSEGKYVTKAMELKMQVQPLSPAQQKKYDNRQVKKKAPAVEEKVEAPKNEPVPFAEPVVTPKVEETPVSAAPAQEEPKKNTGHKSKAARMSESIDKLDMAAAAAIPEEKALGASRLNVRRSPVEGSNPLSSEANKDQLASSIRAVFSGLQQSAPSIDDMPEMTEHFEKADVDDYISSHSDNYSQYKVKSLEPENGGVADEGLKIKTEARQMSINDYPKTEEVDLNALFAETKSALAGEIASGDFAKTGFVSDEPEVEEVKTEPVPVEEENNESAPFEENDGEPTEYVSGNVIVENAEDDNADSEIFVENEAVEPVVEESYVEEEIAEPIVESAEPEEVMASEEEILDAEGMPLSAAEDEQTDEIAYTEEVSDVQAEATEEIEDMVSDTEDFVEDAVDDALTDSIAEDTDNASFEIDEVSEEKPEESFDVQEEPASEVDSLAAEMAAAMGTEDEPVQNLGLTREFNFEEELKKAMNRGASMDDALLEVTKKASDEAAAATEGDHSMIDATQKIPPELLATEEEMKSEYKPDMANLLAMDEGEEVSEVNHAIIENIMAKPKNFEVVPVEPRHFNENETKIFTYFAPIPGVAEQVTQAIADVHNNAGDKTSRSGNVLMIGRQGSGKTRLAESLILAICDDLKIEGAKVAHIDASDFNKKNAAEVVKRMSGGFLVIEGAGGLSGKAVKNLSQAMEFRTDDLVVILEDERQDLGNLLDAHPDFAEKFTSRIVVPVFTNDELVTFGRTYTKEKGYKMDEMCVLALYTMIGDNQKEREPVTVGKVQQMIDQAIARSERGSRKLSRRLSKKETDESGRIILHEKDFDF